jgi:ATP-dependent RNA helicase DeaD
MLLGGAPTARSLLTGEEGWVTLRLDGKLHNVAQVVRRLKEAGVAELGRIQVSNEAAFVDVLPENADNVLVEGIKVTRAKTAPSISAERPERTPRDRSFNRFENRGSDRGFRGSRREGSRSNFSQKRRGQDSRY